MKRILIAILVAAVACTSGDNKSDINYAVGADEFKKVIDQGAILIDVRTMEEYASGHLTGSLNLDIRNEAFEDNVKILDKQKTYAVYCASGVRSKSAADMMRKEGFEHVYTLNEGLKSWKEKGLPVE